MRDNPFSMAAKVAADPATSFKQHLIKEGMSEQEATDFAYRMNLVTKAQKDMLAGQSLPADIAQIVSDDQASQAPLISEANVSQAVETEAVDTQIEQQSWWSSFKSWLVG